MTNLQPLFTAARPQAAPALSAEHALSLLGPSAAMAHLWTQVRRLAPHVRTLLLTGEADCGQAAVARLLLDLSPNTHRTFLELTPAAAEQALATGNELPPADLFLFLPDVDRLSLQAQASLLNLFRARRPRSLAVVAAASVELRPLVSAGRFSAELAEQLGSVRLALPRLKDRREDLPMLFSQMFASRAEGRTQPELAPDFLRAAMEHNWSANLRELSSVVDRLLAREDNAELRASDLREALTPAHPSQQPAPVPVRMVSLDLVMQEHIFAVLRNCQGNKVRASEVLGISRSTLYRMLDAPPARIPLPLAS